MCHNNILNKKSINCGYIDQCSTVIFYRIIYENIDLRLIWKGFVGQFNIKFPYYMKSKYEFISYEISIRNLFLE